MENKSKGRSLLAEMECEVLAEGREWMRQRLERKLRQKIAEQGRISPLERSAAVELPADAAGSDDQRGGSGV